MKRWEIINHYLKTRFSNKTAKYLEIGIHQGENWLKINAQEMTGVDPKPIFKSSNILEMTSDDFFAQNKDTFDLIFIDGLHHQDQVARDFWNSFQSLNPDGIIILHDCAPNVYFETIVPRPKPHGRWNGDGYKAWINIRWALPNSTFTIMTDEGLGIYDSRERAKENTRMVKSDVIDVTWDGYKNNRSKWLNEISLDAFKALI